MVRIGWSRKLTTTSASLLVLSSACQGILGIEDASLEATSTGGRAGIDAGDTGGRATGGAVASSGGRPENIGGAPENTGGLIDEPPTESGGASAASGGATSDVHDSGADASDGSRDDAGSGGTSGSGGAGTGGQGITCTPSCTDPAPFCVKGACAVCKPNVTPTSCVNGNTPQYCDENGKWQNVSSGACTGNMSLCLGGKCTCSLTQCATCTDVKTDGKNCGQCGHDCFGGTCTGGECGPKAILTGQAVYQMAINSSGLYWTDNSSRVTRADLDGANLAVVASQQNSPNGIAADATTVYWSNRSGQLESAVMKAVLPELKPTVLVKPAYAPYDIAVDANYVYVNEYDGPSAAQCSLRDGTLTKNLLSCQERARFGVDTNSAFISCDGLLRKVPIGGVTPATMWDSGNGIGTQIYSITIGASNVFWLAKASSSVDVLVYNVPRSATGPGSAQQMTGASKLATAVFADGNSVYLSRSDGKIDKWTTSFPVFQPLKNVSAAGSVTILAQDAKSLYFSSGNQIFRLAK